MTFQAIYVVGDEVAVNVTIEHTANLMSVDLIYACKEDSEIKVNVVGDPYEVLQDYVKNTGWKRFEARGTGEIGLEHIPGEYNLSRKNSTPRGGKLSIMNRPTFTP